MNATVCRNCKFFMPDAGWTTRKLMVRHGMCTHKSASTTDVVTGEVTFREARLVRKSDVDGGTCGPDGRLFEKEPNEVAKVVRELDWGGRALVSAVGTLAILCVLRCW